MSSVVGGVCIGNRSENRNFVPQAHRSRVLGRRKRSTECVRMAAFSLGAGGSGEAGGDREAVIGARRRCSSSTSSATNGSQLWVSSPGGTVREAMDDDGEALETMRGDAEESREGAGQGVACRTTRMLSEPADKRDTKMVAERDSAASVGSISAARGITMDVVSGSVRAKTPPIVLADAAALLSESNAHSIAGMPSLADLATAVEEAAAQEPTRSPIAAGSPERACRAVSSAVPSSPLDSDGSPGPKSKRAKSGVSVAEEERGASSSPTTSTWSTGQGAWGVNPHASERNTLSSTTDFVGFSSAEGTHNEVKVDPQASRDNIVAVDVNVTVAAPRGPEASTLTNEGWIALLSPLLGVVPPGTHPEDHLHGLLRARGYSTEMVAMKETTFHRAPDPDQVAGYDKVILKAVLDDDEDALERMRLAGRRMDCCNRFGDSIVHMSCRRGRVDSLRYLLRVCPSGVLLSDDFGRTIMHDACWTATPRFDVASAVLDADRRLLRCLDSRGSSPLQYVPQDQWPWWCAFFESRKEIYWPPLAPGVEDVEGDIPLTAEASS